MVLRIYFCNFAADFIPSAMIKNAIWIAGLICLSACSTPKSKTSKVEHEDREAKSLLQGLWMDEATETLLWRIEGDTIYYMDTRVAPLAFKIVGDSMKTYGSLPAAYYICKQGEFSFWIQSAMGETLRLSKVEDEAESVAYTTGMEEQSAAPEVLQKDHVITYNNVRYRGYVYINPTQIKVYNPEITEEGLGIDNVYYDNIIHICVYDGAKKLFGKDVKKEDFKEILPEDYYQRAILSDMDFMGVNANGYQYQAKVCVPNSAGCYLIHISIHRNGDMEYELVL